MEYKPVPDVAAAVKLAEALGRAYAVSVGKPWPMPPDSYGPGRQPSPPAAYFQKYWQAPLDASGPTALDPAAKVLPTRVPVDAVAKTFDGLQVTVTDGSKVTLDFTGTVVDASAAVSADVPADAQKLP